MYMQRDSQTCLAPATYFDSCCLVLLDCGFGRAWGATGMLCKAWECGLVCGGLRRSWMVWSRVKWDVYRWCRGMKDCRMEVEVVRSGAGVRERRASWLTVTVVPSAAGVGSRKTFNARTSMPHTYVDAYGR
jgi:hypothetical protein